MSRPDWWNYDIVLSPHVVKRMADRSFSEIDLRLMLDEAREYRPSVMPGRFVLATRHEKARWEVWSNRMNSQSR